MADYWAKLYIEILDDPKMMRLPDRLFRRITELILYVKSIQSDGAIGELDEVAWKLHLSIDELEQDLRDIEAKTETSEKPGIIHLTDAGWFITNFDKRQGPSPVNERVERYRDKQRKEQYYGNETSNEPGNASGNGGVTNRYTEAEAEAEAEAETESEAEAETEAAAAAAAAPRAIGPVYTKFTQEIGALTPRSADMVGGWLDDYGEEWVNSAIDEAVRANVRKPAYVDAVLQAWKTNGRGARASPRASPKAGKLKNQDTVDRLLARKERGNGKKPDD